MLENLYSAKLKESTIFIIDDEPVNLKLIERILLAEGYRSITTINNPYQVVAEYKKNRPHLILLDIRMPGLNGFDVLDRLKQTDEATLPPIVFISAQNAHEFRIKAFESGGLDFINKPFNRLELVSRVKNLLALESARQELSARNEALEALVELRTAALRKTQLQVIQKLGKAAEFRDKETGAHLLRMSNISALIARKIGFSGEDVQNLLYASPMHDVGKIAIPDYILLKPGRLTDEEWSTMKSHTTWGCEILRADDSVLLQLASEIALSHHEKWNGEGYPNGLAGENIPISCRVVAVADVFDALMSKRPYKEAWSVTDARELINAEIGRQFDPRIVHAFNQHFTEIMEIRDSYCDSESEDAGNLEVQLASNKVPIRTRSIAGN